MHGKIDLLTTLGAYHEDLRRFLTSHDEIDALLLHHDVPAARKKLALFLHAETQTHFAFEESVVFPALLSVVREVRISELLARLNAEHRLIRTAGEEVLAAFDAAADLPGRETILVLQASMAGLSQQLLSHAALEDDEVVPLVRAHAAVRFLSGKLLLRQRLMLKNLHAASPDSRATRSMK